MDGITQLISSDFLIVCLAVGWLLDLLFGDPSFLPHPVVYMGKWIAFGEKRLNRGNNRKRKGALFAVGSILMVFMLAMAVAWLFSPGGGSGFLHNLLGDDSVYVCVAVQSILIFFCLAGKTLRREVRMVFGALQRSLDDGRRQVGRIVGRDTQSLSEQEVATASLETLAENLSDGVVAPLFWFCMFGVPGMLAYKMVNTLDSMIGYQNKRYKDFGCWAAHIDDIANWLPARITALLMIVAGWIYANLHPSLPYKKSLVFCFRNTLRYSRCHASPNSGWPEAALASFLDCRFGGPHDYFGELFYKPFIGSNPRRITFRDMQVSITVCLSAEIIAIGIILLPAILT